MRFAGTQTLAGNGTVVFSSSDRQAGLPPAYTFTAADAGHHTFSITLRTSGSQSVTVRDLANASILGTQSGIIITSAAATSMTVTPVQNGTAGVVQTVTVTAHDQFGNVATGYRDTLTFASNDPLAALPADYTFTAADAGTHTFNVTFKSSGDDSFTVKDTSNAANLAFSYSQLDVMIVPAALNSFAFASPTPSNTIAGTVFSVTLTALDAFGNTVKGYTVTVHFCSTDAQASLPADYTFTAADAGKHTFGVALKTAGTQSLTLQDTVNAATASSVSGILVKEAVTSTFSATGFPATTTAGVAQTFTLTVTDAYGNVATGYRGTVSISSSDAQAGLPINYTFGTADAGVHTFTAILKTAGIQSITVKDTANAALISTQSGINVTASTTAGSFAVTGFPATTAGVAQSFTVTARDAFGNMCTAYAGTVTFSSSDAKAGLPASYTFTAADAGMHTFTGTLKTAGTQSISVKDSASSTVLGSQIGIAVTAATTAASLSVSGFPATTAGASHTFTVTARDAFGNLCQGYTGTVMFSSSDVQAGLPTSYTFTAGDAGSHTFAATLKTAGTQSVTVKDTAGTVVGSQTGITVSAAAAAQFSISAPSSVTQGVGFKFTVTVLDAYGNVVTGYLGKIHLSSTEAKGGTQDYTFSKSDNGVHVFSYTFNALGAQTLNIVDTTNSSILGKATVNVVAK